MADLIHGFKTLRGSDIQRDGMYLELIEPETGDEVAEIFYHDEKKMMAISIFKADLPLDVIEAFIKKAKSDLPS